MSDGAPVGAGQRLLAALSYTYLLAMMTVIAAIVAAAMTMQYLYGELPCPLCLLQRAALFGVCFGIMLTFRHGYSPQNTGISLLFAILLLIVAERQTLLDIYPRPGHAYVGSAVFGLHMPVWSVIIALVLLITIAAKLAIVGGDRELEHVHIRSFPFLARIGTVVSLFVILLCLINLVSVILQCGLNECHTFGYQLLGGPTSASE
ncbi:disulfide bond formation protein B [Bauldia sp.]|uniref:disulfide bond formation protein B n=1 Tax=Bauldia sp. TaxID=2575872 RepID=UPI003BAC5ED5